MTYTISTLLEDIIKKLTLTSDTPRLDAEILLAHVMQVSRAYLYGWPEKEVSTEQFALLMSLVERRLQHEPVPYIVGHQEFWSMDFVVTRDTLVPRPETELLVELVLKWMANRTVIDVADLGTGSGAIALAIAHERPAWRVCATDQSEKALAVAKRNAKHWKVSNVTFQQGHWCRALPQKLFDIIVSNPPYIAEDDAHLLQKNLAYEPTSALVSGQDGLDAIREIIRDAREHLAENGYLLIEHGYDQAAIIRRLFEEVQYKEVVSYRDMSGIERVTVGKR